MSLSDGDKRKLLEAHEQRWLLLKSYNPAIEQETTGLEAEGKRLAQMLIEQRQPSSQELRAFLNEVGAWKMPHRKDEHASNVARNSDSQIASAFGNLRGPNAGQREEIDKGNIEAIDSLSGFGMRMSSAVLRHLWPHYYGVVDWRNWAILSNCEGSYLEESLLERLATTVTELRDNGGLYTSERYLAYLAVLRRLACDLFGSMERVADVDLAIWALSWKLIPSQYTPLRADTIRSGLRQGFAHLREPGKRLTLFETIWAEHKRYIKQLLDDEARYWAWHDLLLFAKEAIPEDFEKFDQAAAQRGPYRVFFERDLDTLFRRLASVALRNRVEDMAQFFFDHMLKGENLGVFRPK